MTPWPSGSCSAPRRCPPPKRAGPGRPGGGDSRAAGRRARRRRGARGRAAADTFAHTKAQLQRDAVARMDAYAAEDVEATALWVERVRDGRIADYMQAVTRR